MATSEINITQKRYLICIFTVACMFVINEFSAMNPFLTNIMIVIFCVCGVLNIVKIYKRHYILITPIGLFSVIWMIIMPLTSFKFPLMEKMTVFQWRCVILGCLFFCIGGLLSTFYAKKYSKDRTEYVEEWKMSQALYVVCLSILFLSIICYFIQAFAAGGFPAFASNPGVARYSFFIPGLGLISNLGFVSIYIIFCDKQYRKKRIFLLLAIIYMSIQFLMAIRFMLVLMAIMLLSTLAINTQKKKQLFKVIMVVVAILVAFVLVMAVRGNANDKEKYFISTGIYGGTAQELVATEVFRYFGMSQRTMEEYMHAYEPGCAQMGLTFSPVMEAFGLEVENPKRYGIHGYTATNIIANMYFDAGNFWWILMTAWSFVMNTWYFGYKNKPQNILSKYLWSLSAISIIMSYYCYINSYTYWCFEYILFLVLIRRIRGRIVFGKRNLL